ncbi:hypothetical protein L603_001000001010 [Cellulosimicrobium cellulans J34]|nr:hypothetical protein L603_001300001000 [Cellulosimicrobium cellulans J34]TWG87401.1 hypothetical protein L603_001000001010 [Cellulosimicrobium cellulans J34]SMF00978.1 hypothetical protein SAMN02744115_00909 [Cellulosimicrobium cellulans J1]
MTTDNDPAAVAELDRLDGEVRAAAPGDTTAQVALWRHVSRLATWFFVARGEPDRPRPYAVAAPQGPMVCLYSSATRARDAAHALGVVPAGEPVPLLAVPMPDAVGYVASLGAAGVVGVALDHPRIGHFVPLANLTTLQAWVEEDAR